MFWCKIKFENLRKKRICVVVILAVLIVLLFNFFSESLQVPILWHDVPHPFWFTEPPALQTHWRSTIQVWPVRLQVGCNVMYSIQVLQLDKISNESDKQNNHNKCINQASEKKSTKWYFRQLLITLLCTLPLAPSFLHMINTSNTPYRLMCVMNC